VPAQANLFQPNRLFPPPAGVLNQQTARSRLGDGAQGEGELVGELRAIGPLEDARLLVAFENGLEGHHIQLVAVLDQGGPPVIFPSATAASAHFSPSFS
jgi:hypothetical protein